MDFEMLTKVTSEMPEEQFRQFATLMYPELIDALKEVVTTGKYAGIDDRQPDGEKVRVGISTWAYMKSVLALEQKTSEAWNKIKTGSY